MTVSFVIAVRPWGAMKSQLDSLAYFVPIEFPRDDRFAGHCNERANAIGEAAIYGAVQVHVVGVSRQVSFRECDFVYKSHNCTLEFSGRNDLHGPPPGDGSARRALGSSRFEDHCAARALGRARDKLAR